MLRSMFWWYVWSLYVQKVFIFGTDDRIEKTLRKLAFKSET